MQLSYLDLTTTDPAWNLAVEEYVFETLPRDRMYVMLWQNDNAIIIGKHQNTLAEINDDFVRKNHIRVVRRLSGGGAVYHDMGNLNYTIIADAMGDGIDFARFGNIVIKALAKIGICAQINGRNDLTIGQQKFSGNAQYVRAGRIMHHGTLLFDSDTQMLSGALQVDPQKISAKGVRSVRSRVTNIRPHLPRDLTLADFRKVLLDSILEDFPGAPYLLTEADLAAIAAIKEARYDTWQWNYGNSPACTIQKRKRIEGCGTVEAYISLRQGLVEKIVFRGDFFAASDPEVLAQTLIGCRPERESYQNALKSTDVSHYIHGLTNEALLEVLA